MNNAYLLEGLAAFPGIAEVLMPLIGEERMDEPTGPGRFTPREVIAHMADWEPRLLARIEAAKANPGVRVEVWDEGVLALENDYAGSDWRERLAALRASRERTIAFLKGLSPSDWDHHFEHPERGHMTIEDQAAFLLGHDLYHTEQLASVAGNGTATSGLSVS